MALLSRERDRVRIYPDLLRPAIEGCAQRRIACAGAHREGEDQGDGCDEQKQDTVYGHLRPCKKVLGALAALAALAVVALLSALVVRALLIAALVVWARIVGLVLDVVRRVGNI